MGEGSGAAAGEDCYLGSLVSMKEYFATLLRYVAWADGRVMSSLQETPAAQEEALPLVAHLLAAEHLWLARLEQRESKHAVWPTLSIDECAQLLSDNEAGYRALLERMSDEQLRSTVRYRTSQGAEFSNTAIEILTQVVTHGPYHRGQIAKILARHGGAPLNTDYILFTREVAQPS